MRPLICLAAGALLFVTGCGDDGTSGSGGSGAGSSNGPGGPNGTGTASGPSGTGSGLPAVGGIFEQPEPWTKDVSGLAASGESDAIIGALDSMGGWGNGNKFQIDFSIPLFGANASTPRRTITGVDGYCYDGSDCDPVPLQMPIPANGNIEGSSDFDCDVGDNDCHILVLESDEKKLYELYNATQDGSGIVALGAFVWDLTKAYPDNERGDQCTSADAAGFPIAGLLPTADEVAAGSVDHAIRFILPNDRMRDSVYTHPASHAGGPDSDNPDAPPYGVRFRLKADFDESPFNAGEKVILHALKKHGMLLSDGGNIALTFADDRTSTAKWDSVGISAQSFNDIPVTAFEVVDLGPIIDVTNDCVRNP